MSYKVGILLVSYNASVAVRITLASLRAAKNRAQSELLVVDNTSEEDERSAIRSAVERHVREAGLPWTYHQEPINLGFSGGNNVGIRQFLADPSITHICLLNSDVIVANGWLDQLLAPGLDVVSAVTNKSESEQCVPTDYSLALDDCLDTDSEALRPGVFAAVDDFAVRWCKAWHGSVVACDPTFFCVLLSRAAVEKIGLLDETFFPGGYEDDDYCERARKLGIVPHLVRDLFIHHWGSASFGQLSQGFLSDNARRNLRHLEQKHDFVWRRRSEKPFVSFAQDVAYALAGAGDRELQRRFCNLYIEQLGKLLANYAGEYSNLSHAVQACGITLPVDLAEILQTAESHGDLAARWRLLCARIKSEMKLSQVAPETQRELAQHLVKFAAALHDTAECNIAVDEFLTKVAPSAVVPEVTPGRTWWRHGLLVLRHGIPFFIKLRGIVFFGGYPYPERESDGYFQRIRVIDGMFDDRWRIYFDPQPLPWQTRWYDVPAAKTLVIRNLGGRLRSMVAKATIYFLALRCRVVYFHSVLRMEDLAFGKLFRMPFIKKILDVHGVVPEEFRMHGDFYSAVLFEAHEKTAARRADLMIVVTEAMQRYLAQKYQGSLRAETIVLPIFPGMASAPNDRAYLDGQPIVVYAGGVHKWQQVPKMIDAMIRTKDLCMHRFYCPDPAPVLEMLPDEVLAEGRIVVENKTHEELVARYRECHFGFILRQDIIINHAACPTKLVEYLAMGIVPIMDCEEVGDFAALGMQFVSLVDFLAGKLPTAAARQRMSEANFEVYARLRAQRGTGVARLTQVIGGGRTSDSLMTRMLWRLSQQLPEGTRRGEMARRIWYAMGGRRRPSSRVSSLAAAEPMRAGRPILPACDILVQVGNFIAGGLENVVIDLNEVLQRAGHKVGLLVLGESGEAVARVRRQGVEVTQLSYSTEAYREWLQAAKPKVVISHYSMDGAEVCADLGIPLVQVIHNIYLWLDAGQRADLRRSAASTTVFVAVSEFARDYSVQRLGLPANKCISIPNGVEVQRFKAMDVATERADLRVELGIGKDEFVFLNVGGINHQKNHLSLLRSFQLCAADCPEARLLILGPPQERDLVKACEAYLKQHDLGDRVMFAGGVSDPQRYYAMADAFVHSAFFEGGPLVLLEALAANLPVVCVETGFAGHFKGCPAVHLVPPHFEVKDYQGHITEMQAAPATEREFAAAMREVYRAGERPNLPSEVIEALDRSNTYRMYAELVQSLVDGQLDSAVQQPRAWPEALAAQVARQSLSLPESLRLRSASEPGSAESGT